MRSRSHAGHILVVAVALCLTNSGASAKEPAPPPSQKTATAVAGEHYTGGGVKRFFLGDTYRDLWTTPVTVPVLKLGAYAGGLTPTKTHKGNQTLSLRFKNPKGLEFSFRLIDKYKINTPKGWENSIVASVGRDQISAQHPAGTVVADGFQTAAGVLHPTPQLVVMPDDPALGKFREDFAGKLGWIEPYPNVPKHGPGFAGAIEIIDTDSLQVLLDADPHQQVNDRSYLRARLVDMFLNDWDRHTGNWKWARLSQRGRWEPIARDRDKVMVGYGGIASISGKVVPELVRFSRTYPSMHSLTIHSLDLDRRILAGLDAAAFDSAAVFLQACFTDAVIDSSLRAMPREYYKSLPRSQTVLRERRDQLREVAAEFYHYLSPYVDIHATDEADRATVTLIDRRHVDVEVRAGDAPPHFCRRFDANDTREVRLYVHDGDDRVVVRGEAKPDLRVRVIGGNGNNRIIDAPDEPDDPLDVAIYDNGDVKDVHYGPTRIKTENADDEPNFDRRPLVDYAGHWRAVPVDGGGKLRPLASLDAPGDLGLVPGLGFASDRYGFRAFPYQSSIRALGEYSTGVDGWRATVTGDKRFADQELHIRAAARMSDLEVLNFYGYGNDTPGGPEDFFAVRQRQWLFEPAVAYALGARTDVTLGPVAQYSTIDDVPDRFITEAQPYGYGNFGQVGFRLGLHGDTRDHERKSHHRKLLLDLSAAAYPSWWDVQKPYGVLSALTATYIPLPVPVHPILALKAGGKKLLGDEFPFQDAAYIGGRPSERGEVRERYAGDASLYGTVELRFPVAQFALLLPLDTGVYVWGDAARVYLNGDSPGGWHTARGIGAWIGILSPAAALTIEGEPGKSGLNARIGLNF
jgi:hypothetical protein